MPYYNIAALGYNMPMMHMGSGLLSSKQLLTTCQQLPGRCCIITDTHLEPLYANALQAHLQAQGIPDIHVIAIPAGETHKTRQTKQAIEDQLFEAGYHRDTYLLALGGGIVLDMVGFTAATFCRGVPVIYLPTSLLAMADAAIGGKTGVNTPQGKNLIGSFTEPHAIFADLDTLSTLPDIEYQHGWAEVIKHALIANTTLFDQLVNTHDKIQQKDPQTLTEILQTSYQIKTQIIQQDGKDHGIRQLLNLGHTIGHALECATDYTLPHGQAVAIGIALESQYAVQQGFLSERALERIMDILHQYNLPTTSPIPVSELYPLMQRDKKSKANQPYFIALSDIGKPYQGGEGGYLQRFSGMMYGD